MATSIIKKQYDDTITSITNISAQTGKFTIITSYGYKQGNHYHIEVNGTASSEITDATNASLFSFAWASGLVSSNKTVGTFIRNGEAYPANAILKSNGIVYQNLTGTISANTQIGFILDFAI